MQAEPGVTVAIDGDASGLDAALKAAESNARSFAQAFASTMRSSVMAGKSFEDTLRAIALRLATLGLEKAFAPIESAIASAVVGIGAPAPAAPGSAPSNASRILAPLFGGPDRTGAAVTGAGMPVMAAGMARSPGPGGGMPMSVVFNVQSPDAPSFRRSESQLTAMLARAVRRGQRNL